MIFESTKPYDISDWYWSIGGDESKLYSSAAATFVSHQDPTYLAFLAAGGNFTRIGSMAELLDMFKASFPRGHLLTYIPSKRYDVETGGLIVGDMIVATDRQSQAMIANAHAYCVASGATSVQYKADSGFITLSAAQVKAIAIAVGAHVQNVFAKEAQCAAGLAASPPTLTSREQIDAVFLLN